MEGDVIRIFRICRERVEEEASAIAAPNHGDCAIDGGQRCKAQAKNALNIVG